MFCQAGWGRGSAPTKPVCRAFGAKCFKTGATASWPKNKKEGYQNSDSVNFFKPDSLTLGKNNKNLTLYIETGLTFFLIKLGVKSKSSSLTTSRSFNY